jgi:hypothetical protein
MSDENPDEPEDNADPFDDLGEDDERDLDPFDDGDDDADEWEGPDEADDFTGLDDLFGDADGDREDEPRTDAGDDDGSSSSREEWSERIGDAGEGLGAAASKAGDGLRTGGDWLLTKLLEGAMWLRSLPGRIKLWILGPADTIGTRIGTVIMFLGAAVLAGGAYTAMNRGLEATGDSSWFMERIIGVFTSLWTYAAIALLFVAVLQLARRRRAAQKAAGKTGFSVKTCLRLAAEARTADGCHSTVIVSPADTVPSAAQRILDAFELPDSYLEGAEDRHTIDEDVVEAAEESAEAAEVTDLVVHERANASPSEHARLTRLEVESALDFKDLFWNFVMPALTVMISALILVKFWVSAWVYGLIFLGGVIAGSAWYMFDHWRRRRHARTLRRQESTPTYDDIAVLPKRVETDDVTAYIGWCAGTVYADYNAIRLAWTLSEVAHAHVEGEEIPPTIQEKFARNIAQYVPNLEGYEEAIEKSEIVDALVEEVARSESKMVPKNKLAERVIQRDKERVGGIGYDPRLVSMCYKAIVPYALVEEKVEVRTPTEGTKTMTAVRLRTNGVPPEVARTEAQFSVNYQPDFDPDFSLPEVDVMPELTTTEETA